jgi:hypothetical protein
MTTHSSSYRSHCTSRIGLAGHLAYMFGKHEEKKPPVISWRRSEDNTKTDVRELGRGSADCIHVATAADLLTPYKAGNFPTNRATVSL